MNGCKEYEFGDSYGETEKRKLSSSLKCISKMYDLDFNEYLPN